MLREGNNGFTCMPGNLKVVGEPPMCVDALSMQLFAGAKAHKPKPTNTVPGITYMLAGRSALDDYVAVRSEDHRTATTHKPTGAYIMWAGSPYAHVHNHGTSIKRFSTSGRSMVMNCG